MDEPLFGVAGSSDVRLRGDDRGFRAAPGPGCRYPECGSARQAPPLVRLVGGHRRAGRTEILRALGQSGIIR